MSQARFLEEAEAEFLKEVQYYAGVQASGAERFRAAIEEATARALVFPSVGCYCADESRCHRSILRRLLKERGARLR